MTMIAICTVRDEIEQLFLEAALIREEIIYHVQGGGFGSLYPGVQIPAYNGRRILVCRGQAEQALEIVREVVEIDQERRQEEFALTSKLRMLVEALLFGWFFPGGRRRSE